MQEIDEFEAADQELADFMEKNQAVLSRYTELARARDTALEQAEKKVRATGTSEGRFRRMPPNVKYDPEVLIEEFGEEFFLHMGGEKKEVSTISADAVRRFLRENKDPDVEKSIEGAKKESQRYDLPKRVLP